MLSSGVLIQKQQAVRPWTTSILSNYAMIEKCRRTFHVRGDLRTLRLEYQTQSPKTSLIASHVNESVHELETGGYGFPLFFFTLTHNGLYFQNIRKYWT
jgi:hypothetical protein